jgi:hypothetical protein
VVLLLLCIPSLALAQDFLAATSGPGDPGGVELLYQGWSSFGDGWKLLDRISVLAMALFLGGVIAYHPSSRRRVSSIEHFEQPKTFLMYALVSSVVALLVKEQPAMAIVVFGIGGLMRFRTMVGEAKDTGRVILVTVVGLCCGLKMYIVAVPAVAIGWLVIYFLEREIAGVIRVSGVAAEKLHEAVTSYRKIIKASECSIIGEQSKFQKREFLFMVSASPSFDRAAMESEFEKISEELRGKVDWEQL